MQKLVGVIFSVIGLGILSAFFNWGSNIPVMQWPVEAYYGLVFTIGWLSPFPDVLVYILATLIMILVAVACYKLGMWVYRQLVR